MELLMQMQREADLAAANPSRKDSPMGFNEMRELAELARKLAYENYLLHIQAVVKADGSSVVGYRAECVQKLLASKSGYEFASRAVSSIENAHAAFLGATAEMLNQNVPVANDFARLSGQLLDAASKELFRLADVMKRSPLFAKAVEAVRKIDRAFDAGMAKVEAKLVLKAAEMNSSTVVSVDTWAVAEVTKGIHAAAKVATDLAARVVAMPARIVEAAKAARESIVTTTARFAAGFLSRTFAAGQLVERKSDEMFDAIDKTVDEIWTNIQGEAAGVAVKVLDTVGKVVGAAVTKLDKIDASIDNAGARLAPLVGANLPQNLKDRIEARLGAVPATAAEGALAVAVSDWKDQPWAVEAASGGSNFQKFTESWHGQVPVDVDKIDVGASLEALDAAGKQLAQAALVPVSTGHGSGIDEDALVVDVELHDVAPVRERMTS